MTSNATNPAAWMLRPGDKVDKFEIVGQIGAGGMSIVFKGYDRLLDRPVAIKQINFDFNAAGNVEALRERFRREAVLQKKAAGQHKNLTRIIDFIEDQRGLFIIMEYVEGQSLEHMLAHTPAPFEAHLALGIVGAVALGLGALHQDGVVHRDLKPANILLAKDGGLKVCDFGLATLIGQQDALDAGTVRYMAPESFDESQPAGPKADIYALGMIAYEMLAGREKFNEAFKIVLRDQRNQALRWMKWHTNPRVSAAPLHTLNPAVPPKLAELVGRMMEKDPDKRIGSADELVAAIRRHFSGKHEEPRAATVADATLTANPTAPLPKKKPLSPMIWVMLAVAAVLVLAAGAGLVMIGMKNAKEQQRLADIRNQAVQTITRLKKDFDAGKYDAVKPGYEKLAENWKHDATLYPYIEAPLLYIQAMQEMKDRNYEQAVRLLDDCRNRLTADGSAVVNPDLITQKRDDALRRGLIAAQIREAETAFSAGDYDKARTVLRGIREPAPGRSTPPLLNPEEIERIDQLVNQIDRRENQGKLQAYIDQAKGMWDSGRRTQAVSFLDDAFKQTGYSGFRELARQYRDRMALDKALGDLTAAETANNWNEAIVQATKVLALDKANAAVERKLRTFRANAAYARGVELENAGSFGQAKEQYRAAVSEDNHRGAAAALERLKSSDEKEEMLRAAEGAEAGGNWEGAINQYDAILKLGADPQVSARKARAELQRDVTKARTLAEAVISADGVVNPTRLADARAALNTILRRDSANAPAREISERLDRLEQYWKHATKGDDFRNQGKYGEAQSEYAKAQAILDSEVVRQRRNDTEYDSLLANVRRDVQAQNWPNAKSWLDTLRRNYSDRANTDELKKLRAEVEKHLSAKPSEGT